MGRDKEKVLLLFGATMAWSAVVLQYVLMLDNRVAPVLETTVRFFSFYTILTNTLVALCFTALSGKRQTALKRFFRRPGRLTALTVYITVVGLVYQLVLRPLWAPQGLGKVADELLHSVIPAYVILCWLLFEDKQNLRWKAIPYWLLYPLCYLLFVMARGAWSGFYPYPFLDVTALGYEAVLANALGLTGVFVVFSALYISLGKALARNRESRLPGTGRHKP